MAKVVIDEVAIDIIPELGRFLSDLRRGALPAAEQVGREIGQAIGRQASRGVVDGVLDGLRKAKARAAGAKIDIKADLDTLDAYEGLHRLEGSGGTVDLDADVEIAAAEARIRAFRDREEHDAITIPVRTNNTVGGDRGDGQFVGAGIAGVGSGGGAAASGINQLTGALSGAGSGMSYLIAAGIALAPAIVPAAAAAAGAIGAIGTAASVAGAAAGVLALGFSGISDAYGALDEQSKKTGASGAAAAKKVAQAFKELSPAGQEFVIFLFTKLKPAFDSLKFTAQESLLPGVQAAIGSLAPLLPKVTQLVQVFGAALGGIAQQVADALNGPEFSAFLDYLITEGPKILGYLTTIGLSLGKVFTTLIVALGPSTDAILKGFSDFLAHFAEWVAQVVQTPEFQDFLDYIIENAPVIASLLLSLLVIFVKLAIAFAPFGAILLDGITTFFEYIASLDPNTILIILTLVAVAIGAIAIVIGGPVGVIVAIVALVAAVVGLFALFTNLWPAISGAVVSAWNAIKGALDAFWTFLTVSIPEALASAYDYVVDRLNAIVSVVFGLPGRLAAAGRGMWSWISNSIKDALNDALNVWNRFAARFGFSLPGILGGGRLALPQLSYFAAGGIVPGYTPGIDNHLAAVSGGEAIMRPEWTHAIGPQYVAAANSAARTGGVAGVQSFIGAMGGQRFASGGVFRPTVALPVQRNIGRGTPTVGAAQPLVGAINLYGAKATTRQDAYLIGNELGWQLRTGAGPG